MGYRYDSPPAIRYGAAPGPGLIETLLDLRLNFATMLDTYLFCAAPCRLFNC
jgi:hypothetical protein